MGGGRPLGARLAQAAGSIGRTGQTGVERSVPRRKLRAAKKGSRSRQIKRGRGIRVMLVADGEGLLTAFNWRSPTPRASAGRSYAGDRMRPSPRTGQTQAAPRGVGGRQGLRQQTFQAIAARTEDKTDDPALRAAGEKAPQTGTSREGRSGLRGVLEGGAYLHLLDNFRRLLVRHELYLSTFRAFFLVAFASVLLRHFLDGL